jgi:diguanylate cyclase (GGDEF)-like protein/PAS domain S-box-containing protein
MAVLIILHYTLPGLHTVTWALIGSSSVLALFAGIARNHPPWKLPWVVLALSTLFPLVGQLISLIVTRMPLEDVSAPQAAVLYLLNYPLSVLGLILIIRANGLISDSRSTIDALIMTLGLGLLLAWVFLVHPGHVPMGVSTWHKVLAVVYPIGDVIILGVLARLLMLRTARDSVVRLLVIGAIGVLISDVATGRSFVYGTVGWVRAFDLGWAISYATWGAAALHPHMAQLSGRPAKRPPPSNEPKAASGRMVALLATALIPPVFLLVRTFLTYRNIIELTAAATSAALFGLVLSRLWDVNISHERGQDRERALRMTGVALARAATIDGIGTVVRKATGDLLGGRPGYLGGRPDYEALFGVRKDDELAVVATSSDGSGPASELAKLIPGWLPRLQLLKSAEPKLVAAADLNPAEKEAVHHAGHDAVLLCPLVLTNRPSGDPLIGVVAILGDHRMLSGMSSALGIAANQVALALERVLLSEEVVRQRGEALFRTLVQDALDVILVLNDEGTIKYASPSATRLYGDIPINGADASTLVADAERVDDNRKLDPVTSEDADSGLYRMTRHDGEQLLVEVRITDLRRDETVQGQVLTVRDVTEEHHLQGQLKHQAFHDTLTGLPNRALFTDRAKHALAMAQRNGTTAAVLFVDLDDFKVVNDTMGHGVGDELLIGVAERLATVARRSSDTACRLGGDEFALLIEALNDPKAVEAFADRVVAAFSQPFELSAGSVPAGATVGVATTQDSTDVDELLRHADMSLYAAKAEGKRRWHHYTSALSADMDRRREMQETLEDTVDKSAFTLAYQPIVELATGAIRGFKALVRWPHPVPGTAPPKELLQVAEETGLIIPLGAWILRQSIADMARWRGTDPDPHQPAISVNVSPRQFRDPGFVRGLRRCLNRTGLAPTAVMLELTESSLLRRDEWTTSNLAELKDLGVRLVIEDFGTGYSLLSYLRDLPVDTLKIDKSFVDTVTESPQGRKFAEIIIDFAHAMGIEVIAEGIETDDQRALLIQMGCRLGQGHLLATPVDWRKAEELLRSGQLLTRDTSRHGAPWPRPLPGGEPVTSRIAQS